MVKVFFEEVINNNKLKDMQVVDMHCHTNVSDGLDTTEIMIKQAKKLNIGISITDHNEVSASLKACKKIFSIPGIEITSSDAIDFLVYFYKPKDLEHFYNKYIKGKHLSSRIFNLRKLQWNTIELLEHLEKYNCVTVLPHPLTMRPKNSYIYMHNNPELMKYLDCIEVINSIMSPESNEKVTEWARELKVGATGASDAHMHKNLGKAVTASYANTQEEFLNHIIKEKNIVIGKSLTGFRKFYNNAYIFRRNLKW